ncbi:MAG: sulfatase [Candidatus Bathyarchaeota archaeon]|nr:MAG: sulfatase [Candidatus Bathyarchaeota archaeon]
MAHHKPNIILISMDTVRQDHLSCYGYHRMTTPNIDRIARHGVLYENAFSAAPWTPPSHASIFTGKYPSHHKTLGKDIRFKKENTSIAEILNQAGYQTIGLTCCQILGHGSEFERGFDEYFELREPSLSDIKNLNRSILKDLARTMIYGSDEGTFQATQMIKSSLTRIQKSEKPFFLFVNYFSCHTPYDPPRHFKQRFCKEFSEKESYVKKILLKTLLGSKFGGSPGKQTSLRKLRWIANGGGGFSFAAGQITISKEEWEIVKAWYDAEIAYLDYNLGNLFHFLQSENIYDNTFVVITSDHGENFGEHGLAVHPLCLYDTLLRVPLIISCPSLIPEGRRIPSLVSTIDIFPTLLDISKTQSFEEDIQGRSLFPFDDRRIHDFICAEYGGLHTQGFGGLKAWNLTPATKKGLLKIDKGCKCIRDSTYKYILWADKQELYNISNDPQETVNIAHKNPRIVESLREKMEKTIDISYFGPHKLPVDGKQKAIDRLKALGYI